MLVNFCLHEAEQSRQVASIASFFFADQTDEAIIQELHRAFSPCIHRLPIALSAFIAESGLGLGPILFQKSLNAGSPKQNRHAMSTVLMFDIVQMRHIAVP